MPYDGAWETDKNPKRQTDCHACTKRKLSGELSTQIAFVWGSKSGPINVEKQETQNDHFGQITRSKQNKATSLDVSTKSN
jgi:hypothetical protein